jgi:hypothetical protein
MEFNRFRSEISAIFDFLSKIRRRLMLDAGSDKGHRHEMTDGLTSTISN